jgi:hypothetical protein
MHNPSGQSFAESSPTPDTTDLTETISDSTDDPDVTSRLGLQLEAAVRDVEDLLVVDEPELEVTAQRETSADTIDWSAPDLLVPEGPVITRDATYDALAELDEEELGQSIGTLQLQIGELADTRVETENFVLRSVIDEARLRADAGDRRREEEAQRLQLEEDVARRRNEDEEDLKAQVFQVQRAESQAQQVRDEQARLRAELKRLNDAAEALLQRKSEREQEERDARLAAAQRARDEAEQIHVATLARLHSDEESLRSATVVLTLRRNDLDAERQRHEVQIRQLEEEREEFLATVAHRNAEHVRLRNEAMDRMRFEQEQLLTEEVEQRRFTHELEQKRAELERARQAAEVDARRIAEAWAMMRTAEESGRQAERERLTLEAEIFQRADEQTQWLETARRRAEEQHRLFDESTQQRVREEERSIAELEGLHARMEESAQLRGEREALLRDELARLKSAEEVALQRIEEFDLQRLRESEKNSQTIERLQRLEAEAKMRSADENAKIAELERRLNHELERLTALEQQHRETAVRMEEAEDQNPIQPLQVNDDTEMEVADESDWEVPSQDVMSDTLIPVFQNSDYNSSDADRRAASLGALARLGSADAYERILSAFDDPSPEVRNAAARALYNLDAEKPVESFTRALKESSEARRENIGRAIYGSGLANEAINRLCSANREETYNALCLLFTMAKTGKVDALVHVIETHEEVEIRLAAVRLLTLSGHADLANAAVKRRLRVNQG